MNVFRQTADNDNRDTLVNELRRNEFFTQCSLHHEARDFMAMQQVDDGRVSLFIIDLLDKQAISVALNHRTEASQYVRHPGIDEDLLVRMEEHHTDIITAPLHQ